MQPTACANCDAPLQPAFDYCPACGQTTHLHRINGHHLAHELLHFFTHADKGIFFLIKELAVRPGIVAREYIAGRRKKYFSPFNFFFIVIGLFVLTLSFFQTMEKPNNFGPLRAATQTIPDVVVRQRRLHKIERMEASARFVDKYSNFVSMVAAPIAAFIFFLFYRKRGYNFSEHLIVCLYMAGFAGLVFIIFFAPLISALSPHYYFYGLYGYFIFLILYRTITYYQFDYRKGKAAFLYALLASTVSLITWSLISGFLNIYYINHGFKI